MEFVFGQTKGPRLETHPPVVVRTSTSTPPSASAPEAGGASVAAAIAVTMLRENEPAKKGSSQNKGAGGFFLFQHFELYPRLLKASAGSPLASLDAHATRRASRLTFDCSCPRQGECGRDMRGNFHVLTPFQFRGWRWRWRA